MALVHIDGATIHYALSGSGSPLLMLLPQSSGPEGRAALLDGLARSHTVVTYDQRGSGASSRWSQPMSMTQQAEDAIAVLDDARIERAHLFCHSTGCGIGLALASMYERRVASLSLVNPWTWGDPHLTTTQRLRIAAARALQPEQYARFNAGLLFPPEYRRSHESGFARLAAGATRTPHDPCEIARRLEAILAFDARPLLAGIDAPSLVVSARDDQLMPPWFAAEAAARLPHATLLELDGGGHMLPETRTAELLDLLLAHLLRVDGSGTARTQPEQ